MVGIAPVAIFSYLQAKEKDMNILKFVEEFPDEKSCRENVVKARTAEGVVCKKCLGKKHYWLKGKWAW